MTGTNGGIGQPLVRALAADGARILAHGRDAAVLERAFSGVPGVERTLIADLSSLADAARLADAAAESGGLDVIVHNAGIGFGSDRKRRETSRDGYELRFAVNYLAPFLITERLVRRGLPTRAVVSVASAGQAPLDLERDPMTEHPYDGVLAYRRSKLALVMDTFERARRDRSRIYVALHPGTFLATKMVKEAGITPMGTAESGAEAVADLTRRAAAGEVASGTYLDVRREAQADESAYAPPRQDALRARTLTWLAPFLP